MSLLRFGRLGSPFTSAEIGARLRRAFGLRGLPNLSPEERLKLVVDLVGLEDHAYADEPGWWALGLTATAIAAQFADLQFANGGTRATVDGAIVSSTVANRILIKLRTGASGGTAAILTNRGVPGGVIVNSKVTVIASSQAVAVVAPLVSAFSVPANVPFYVPLRVRLGPAVSAAQQEALEFQLEAAGVNTITVAAWGREFSE